MPKKFIELTLHSNHLTVEDIPDKMLVPIEAITTVKQYNDITLVFVNGLQLYAQDYYNTQQYSHAPDNIDTEVIETSNEYNALKFLIMAGTRDSDG